MPPANPRVFISYSHDSQEHRRRVLELAQALRADGVDAWIDRFELSPTEGWPRWMINQIQSVDFVIIVGTPTYKARFEGREAPGRGLGVSWEGLIATQFLYENAARNERFIPVIFEGSPDDAVPTALRAFQFFRLPSEYTGLLRLLTKQPAVAPAALGPVPELKAQSVGTTGSGTLYPQLEIQLEGEPKDLEGRLEEVQDQLERATGSRDLLIVGVEKGSTRLLLAGPEEALEKLKRLIETGAIESIVGLRVIQESRVSRVKATGPPWFADAVLINLFHTADRLGLASDGMRVVLLSGLHPRIAVEIPRAGGGPPQLLVDLRFLNGRGRLADGALPIKSWLDTAALLTELYEDSNIFREAVKHLDGIL